MAFNPELFKQLLRVKRRNQALGILFKVIAIVAAVAVAGVGGYTVYQSIANQPDAHEHEFSAEWSSDETNHWHAAICEDGEECASATADLAEHTFEEGACSVCGYVDPTYVPECTEHAPGAPEVIKPATCTEAGERKFTCTVCGYSWTQEIAPEGHDEVTLEGKAPTCTTPGLSSGKQCSVCGEITKAQSEVNPIGHKFVEGTCEICGEFDPEYTGPRTYVLGVQSMEQIAQKDKADGDTATFGNFFTIYYSAKFKLDGSDKTFDDGFSGSQRLNWGGGTDLTTDVKDSEGNVIGEVIKNAIEFVVPEGYTASVKVWWVCGGTYTNADGVDVPRQVAIYAPDESLVVASNLELAKNATGISEFTLEEAGKYYLGNLGNTNYFFEVQVVLTPVEEEPAKEIKVETTDTYTMYDLDFFTFTATTEGYYTFKIPAGLGVLRDGANAPEIDYYDNANGHEFTIGLKADQEVKFWVSSTTKDLWTIEWSFEEGEVKEDEPDTPIEGDATELVVGSNTVVFGEGQLSEGKTYPFVVTEEGTYTFRCDLMAVVMDADGNTMGRGQAYLVPGNYTVALFSMMPMPANSFVVNVTFEAPATGEPDGSEQFPYVWETLPESVTFESDNMNMVYYIFTATTDGYVSFTWAVEGNDWFNIYELDENGNTTANSVSGYAKTTHKFVIEAGKTYRVGLGTWNEGGETVVAIAAAACEHVWSDATCETLSTCSNCGCTTGDFAEHTPSIVEPNEPTCSNPSVCTVCGQQLSYVDHSWNEGVVNSQPDCANGIDGSITYTCTVCGETQTDVIWAYHQMEETYVYATCTENGSYHGVCTVCGYEESNVIEAQGHTNYDLSCGETGECFECGETFTLDHTYVEPATCTTPGFCYGCNQTVGQALGHKYDETGLCTECYLTHTLVVAGSEEFTGSNWTLEDEDNVLSYDYENFIFYITYENVAQGFHEFKVIDVTNGYNWNVQYPTSNYRFYTPEGAKVVISVDLKAGAMTCQVYAPGSDVATDGTTYMVVGDNELCGDVNPNDGDWGWELGNFDNMLTLGADGKYVLVYEGVAVGSYGIKVVKNGSYSNEWGDNGSNYMIDVTSANSTVTIYFDPTSGISHTVEVPHEHSYFYPCDAHCQECGELTNPNATHNIVHVEAKAGTDCQTYDGNIEYWACSDCGYVWADEALTQQTNRMNVVVPGEHSYFYSCDKVCQVCYEETNPNATHTIVHVEAKAATCYENGNIEYWYCEVCGQAWLDEACTLNTNLKAVVLPMAHAPATHVEAKAATCVEDGNIEYWYCEACGQAWLDEACTLNTNVKSVILPALGHEDENGDFKCDACSTKMLPEDGTTLTIPQALAIAKLHGHNTYTTQKYYITGIVTNVYNTTYGNLYLKDAEGNEILIYGLYTWGNGSSDGTRYDKMDYKPVEGDELTVYTVLGMYNSDAQGKNAWIDDVVAHEHDYEINVTAPTCTKGGYTTHTCTICEGYYTDNETEATGHSTDNGTCEYCGQTIGGDAPAYESFKADFNTVASTNTSYVKSTTTSGWVATNCAVVKGGTSNSSPAFVALGDATERGFVLNGKTSAKGSIVSSTISGGISKLSLNYANVFSESNGVDITITIKQNGTVVATKKVDNNSVTQYTGYEVVWDLAEEGVAVSGDFTIEITNNSPSNSTKNKDRVAIWNVQWTNNPVA